MTGSMIPAPMVLATGSADEKSGHKIKKRRPKTAYFVVKDTRVETMVEMALAES